MTIKHLVRIANTDLRGTKRALYALANVKGVKYMLANAVLRKAEIDLHAQIGSLSPEQVGRINSVLEDPLKAGIPRWMLNRRKDRETGTDLHLLSTKLKLQKDADLKELKKIKCYRGVRHMFGLPCRGQKTRSNYRKNKGKVNLGVKVKGGKKKGRV
ncbi:30S ribosomal protein S13 [Nanoarchaeota archaeon]